MMPSGRTSSSVASGTATKLPGFDLAQHRRPRQQAHAGVDLDRPLDRFDIVELHHDLHFGVVQSAARGRSRGESSDRRRSRSSFARPVLSSPTRDRRASGLPGAQTSTIGSSRQRMALTVRDDFG